jgi:hypothetical protein
VTLRNKLHRLIAPLVAFLLLLAYLPFGILAENSFKSEVLRSLQGNSMAVIFGMFVIKMHRAYNRDVPDSARRFYLGLILWSFAAAMGGVWFLLWYMSGGGPNYRWMLINGALPFLLWMEVVGIFFMLSGPAIPGDKLGDMTPSFPQDISWKRIILAATFCGGMTYLVVVQRVGASHIRAFLELLRPH